MSNPLFLSQFSPPLYAGVASVVEPLDGELTEAEASLLSSSASPTRRRSYLLGRAAAHRALEGLGQTTDRSVLVGPRREPIFPPGIIGSLTHSNGWALAAVAHRAAAQAVGIDLQLVKSLPYDISSKVCTASELEWCNSNTEERQLRVLQIFSAKESVYKALAPIVGRYFGFSAAELTWNNTHGNFSGVLLEDLGSGYNRGWRFVVHAATVSGVPPLSWNSKRKVPSDNNNHRLQTSNPEVLRPAWIVSWILAN